MIHFGLLALFIVIAMGLLTWLCLAGSRRSALATAVFIGLSSGAFAVSIESSGQPKPIMLEWRNLEDANLVGLAWDESQHIVWAWVQYDGAPIAYALPWPKDKKKFGEMQDRWRRRGITGDEFEYDAKGDVAKVTPPKEMPPKQ